MARLKSCPDTKQGLFRSLLWDAFDFAPAVVLRFEQKKLIDVGSEFKSHFDRQIATVQAQRWPPRRQPPATRSHACPVNDAMVALL
jgi:hypothetical protein